MNITENRSFKKFIEQDIYKEKQIVDGREVGIREEISKLPKENIIMRLSAQKAQEILHKHYMGKIKCLEGVIESQKQTNDAILKRLKEITNE